jgi:succinate dehydrogenase / fumarate reductase membrane anchor subunit
MTESFRTALARVRGLGSAGEGTAHWWAQRLTAIALVPLTLWFVISIVMLTGAGRGTIVLWLARPFNIGAMLLLLGVGIHHAQLGLQVVIEDYVHAEPARTAGLMAMKFAAVLLALVAAVALLSIFVRG